VLLTLTGLVVTSAALVRSGHRLRRLARPSYDRLVEAARHSVVQHVDETGWKIGGRSAWLWVFADEHATLYRIRQSRGHEVVVEVLGEDYPGVLVSDCFLAYDPLNFRKSKCAAHLLRRCSEIEQSKSRGAVRFSRRVAALYADVPDLAYLGGHTLGELLDIERRATAGALAARGRPNMTLTLDTVEKGIQRLRGKVQAQHGHCP